MAKKLKEPVYAVMPHPSDKIFKYVKSKYEPIDKDSESYKLFMDNYKKYRNSKEVKKLNQSLKENIKKSIKMELMNKQDFLKSLNKQVNESENNKTFICEWNLEVYPKAKSLTCTPSDFTDENGYSEEDITSILSLEPGCKYELDGGNQVVTCCPLVPLETEPVATITTEPVLPAEPVSTEPKEMATATEPLSMEDFENEEDEEDDDEFEMEDDDDDDDEFEMEDEEESEMNEYLSKETVPVFKGLSAYNKPIEFIEPNKTPSKIESILSSGKDVVIAAKIAKQHPDVPEHKKESEFNVTSVEGNTINVISAKYKHEYEITDPRKVEELYIVDKKPVEESAINEAKATDIFTIECETTGSMGNRPPKYSYQEGTLAELIDAYKYTLDTGKSYESEKGNSKINTNPKNVEALVKNLNNAVNNSAANGYAGKDYRVLKAGEEKKK